MIVTAWNNGEHHKTGAGYGVKIDVADRDQFFQRDWKSIILEIEGKPEKIEVNIEKDSFWGKTCRELINKEIGIWMLQNGLAPWPQDHPSQMLLEPKGDRHFCLKLNVER